jgi:hypothetical protein
MPSDEVMHKFHHKELYSGGGNQRVTNRKQAIAIMLSEKRNEARHGGRYKHAKKKKRSLADAYHERRESRKTERKESRNFYTAED